MDKNSDETNLEISDDEDVMKLLNEMDRELSPEEIEKRRQEKAQELESKGFYQRILN